MRQQYWTMMTQKKFSLFYLGLHLQVYERIERVLDITLAIISTGSLAGLFICEECQWFLTVVLALAQVVTAARPYLPYANRIKELDKGILLLKQIYLEIEKTWNEISISDVEDMEVNKLRYKYEKKWEDIDGEILKNDSLPRKEKYIGLASEENERYFANLFGGTEE